MSPEQTIESTKSQSFGDWLEANTRAVSIGAAVVVVAAAGYWFYMRSAEIRRMNAERSLIQAKQSLSAGNSALAQNDLQRIATRYTGTPAGSQAAMLLAQMDYDEGKFADGIKILQPYETGAAAGPNLSAVWSLRGDGELAAGKPADAASSYKKAADGTTLPGERAIYQAKAARALMAAGRDAEARTLWAKLASDPDAVAVKNEAEIRLGELSARPAGRS